MAANTPIEHVVIIVKENHTFDNYFGKFTGANGDTSLDPAPDPPAFDPPHDHKAWLARAANAVRQQYAETDIPNYFAYARQFTLCDNYFTEIASQSTPNHLMLIAADSPLLNNPHAHDPIQLHPPFDLPSLPKNLEAAGSTWGNYGGYAFDYITGLKRHRANHKSEQFQNDVAGGSLPTVSWLYAPENLSEHPPHGRNQGNPVIAPGMQWTVEQINAIAQSPLWDHTAIFVTWDDWGGWYDHVEPQNVEQWPDDGTVNANTQFRYGPRVPCLVISPYAKRGYISKVFHSHVSLVKFCEVTFGLQPINARDAAADDMSDCFDYTQTPIPLS